MTVRCLLLRELPSDVAVPCDPETAANAIPSIWRIPPQRESSSVSSAVRLVASVHGMMIMSY